MAKSKKIKASKKGVSLWNRAKKIIPGGNQLLSKRSEMFLPDQWPSYYKKAKGVEVWDLDGNKYIDMSLMGVGSCILGYADPDVNKAVIKAIQDGSMSTLNCPEEVELAELLCSLHPWASMVRYARTGGEAMAIAVRVARAHSRKDKVAFCGYHGWSDWYLSANIANDKNLDGHLLPGLAPAGVPRGLKGTMFPFHYNHVEELEKIVAKHKDIGVIAMEPLKYAPQEKDFLKKVRMIADKIGAVLVFDEISIGWRKNVGGAHLSYGVNPDIAVFAKAMSNGFPMAAIIGRKEVMQTAQKTFVSSTYWSERVGPVAAIAAIKKMKRCNVPVYLKKITAVLAQGLKERAEAHSIALTILGPSPLIALAFNHGVDSQTIKTLFTQEMLARGFLASTSIMLSYAHTAVHIKKYLKAVDEVFALIKKAIDEKKLSAMLKGPVSHSGFQRLN
ncbi:MAG: aminotransferase class III-fold pyridoxal phosphate-dependent enzyme [Parcubacteria group bacterium]|nr:aminotransferase class III-fold pyridoxal phosphate-dependent enzyme [Parcubacteria group bacterium]